MVLSFAQDSGIQVDNTLVVDQIRSGDISVVLQEYETDLKHPSIFV